MQRWAITYQSDKFYPSNIGIELSDAPLWAILVDNAVEYLDATICRHRLCSPPEWMFRLPLSLRRDEEGWWENSVGFVVMRAFNRACANTYKHREVAHKVYLTHEIAEAAGIGDLNFDHEEN